MDNSYGEPIAHQTLRPIKMEVQFPSDWTNKQIDDALVNISDHLSQWCDAEEKQFENKIKFAYDVVYTVV